MGNCLKINTTNISKINDVNLFMSNSKFFLQSFKYIIVKPVTVMVASCHNNNLFGIHFLNILDETTVNFFVVPG